jgi:ribosomal-protein-alanine N-acetyltransferase
MSVVLKPVEARFEPTGVHHLDLLMRVEQRAYAHPWTRANFTDSLAAGYPSQVLMGGDDVLGYFFAMKGVDEVHLLNITVAPEFQRQGWSRVMLDALAVWSRAQGAQWLWLEVRVGNTRALAVYEKYGFRRMGQRKNYYPAAHGQREDALVMSLRL